MYKISVDGLDPCKVETKKEQLLLDEKQVDWSLETLADGSFSVICEGKSYRAELLEVDRTSKMMKLCIEGRHFSLKITEPVDTLLSIMGLHGRRDPESGQIKAPMPGLVLKVLVTRGYSVAKGEPLLILEAMKMENVFKSPDDAVVKEIRVAEGDAVEKGQVLLILE